MSARVTTGSKQHTSGPFNPVAPHRPVSPSPPYTAINNRRLCNDKIEERNVLRQDYRGHITTPFVLGFRECPLSLANQNNPGEGEKTKQVKIKTLNTRGNMSLQHFTSIIPLFQIALDFQILPRLLQYPERLAKLKSLKKGTEK